MNSDPKYTDHVQPDEISLQELFMALWKRKILIIVITLIAGLAAGLFSIFAIKPVYHSRLNIIINMPVTYTTKYGDYVLPISSNDQYISLITSNDILKNTIIDMGYDPEENSIEALRDRITIVKPSENNAVQNSFYINVASDDPEDARKLAEVLYRNYIEFIDSMVAEGTAAYFIDYYTVSLNTLRVQLESDKELLEKNRKLLETIPRTIIQGDAMQDTVLSDRSTDYIVVENIINPNYTELELDILELKQAINETESNMKQYNQYIKELEAEQNMISDYFRTGDFSGLSDSIVRITTSNIYLPSEPVAPFRKSSPNNVRNALIGILIGGVVSVLIALIKEFWFTKSTLQS
jgi:capsular polysaccharide biosynthesis protein